MLNIKICGIKRVLDAELAVAAGADAIGLLVGQTHRSTDFISPEVARSIVASLPGQTLPVLVTHLTDPAAVAQLVALTGVSAVQVHGEMSPAAIRRLRDDMPAVRFIKSFHVTGPGEVEYGAAFEGLVDGFVLDSVNVRTGQIGGTGQTHDWSISRRIVARYPNTPVILAGGLNPENVAAAIAAVGPHGVDVNSGTKGADGFKDPGNLIAFVANARAAFAAKLTAGRG